MQFDISAAALAKPLSLAAIATDRRATMMPILGNLLLAVASDQLAITAGNLETELSVLTPAAVEADGTTTVDARKLVALAKSLPADALLRCRLDGGRLLIRAGASRFALATRPAEEFPAFALPAAADAITLDADALLGLIDRTCPAVAVGDVRYYLNGLYLERTDGLLRAVGSDGHRLSLAECACEGADIPGVILPRPAVLAAAKMLGGQVSLSIGPRSVQMVMAEGIRYRAKLIEGRFPDWRSVVPRTVGATVQAGRRQLLDAVGRVGLLAENRAVRLGRADGELVVSSANSLEEYASESLPATFTGDLASVAANAGYLQDALAHLDGETVCVSATPDRGALLLTAPDNPAVRHVVMPMRD